MAQFGRLITAHCSPACLRSSHRMSGGVCTLAVRWYRLVASIWAAPAIANYDGSATRRRIEASIVSTDTGFCQSSSQTGAPKANSCSALASTTGTPRQLWLAPESMEKLDTIHTGHRSVRDNEDGLHPVGGVQARVPITGRLDTIAFELQDTFPGNPDTAIVIH